MGLPVKLSELYDFISCPICRGYLIDATTVTECLHTFCKSCIVKHIKNDNNDCPKCKTVIHERRPLDYIIQDRNKQDIVYKLVPQLYISELNERLKSSETVTKYLHIALVQRRTSTTSSNLQTAQNTIYLACPLQIKISHIRKLLGLKYQLGEKDRVIIFYKGDIVNDDDHISNLAQSYTFCLQYEISRICS